MTASPPDLELICDDFAGELERLRRGGARLEIIYPADEPHTAILSQDGRRVRLTSRPEAPPRAAGLPEFRPAFTLVRAGADSGEGRAGMRYRDLIPGRLGGRYIASHITIAEGGPVPDWVHFHRIAVQLIFVRTGWVRVVYEGQGGPFVAAAGDIILQPPEIRHRVLESSPAFEAIEITCPALHETFAEHDMMLPGGPPDPARAFGGQRFLHHVAAMSPWLEWNGGEARGTAASDSSGGLADARTLRPGASPVIAVLPHDGELVFGFVLRGSVRLEYKGEHGLGPADCFVIPPGEPWTLSEMSDDLRLLHVTTARIDP
ncbi:MAG TPA: hypothetical protein VF574_11565 [Allosphingosinicella sp.]